MTPCAVKLLATVEAGTRSELDARSPPFCAPSSVRHLAELCEHVAEAVHAEDMVEWNTAETIPGLGHGSLAEHQSASLEGREATLFGKEMSADIKPKRGKKID